MESELLKVINDEVSKITNYEYGEYTGTLVYPYTVGEYNEKDYQYENNGTNGDYTVTYENNVNVNGPTPSKKH